MKHGMLHPLLGLAFLLFCLSCAFIASAQSAADATTTHVFRLKHVSTGLPLAYHRIDFPSTTAPLAREPDFGGRQIFRGRLPFGRDSKNAIAFALNKDAGRLHLDLNRNGDLTDDPVFENKADKRQQEFHQEFRDITLTSPRGPQYGLWTANLSLSCSERSIDNVRLEIVSGWEAEIDLHGKKVSLSVPWEFDDATTFPKEIALRPSGKRHHPMYCIGPPSKMLFYDGHLYDLSFKFEPAEMGGVVIAGFAEVGVPLGEYEVAGQRILRLRLFGKPVPPVTPISWQDRITAVLDEPRGRVLIPVGEYFTHTVFLDGGTSLGVLGAYLKQELVVSTSSRAIARLGLPLDNTVRAGPAPCMMRGTLDSTDVGRAAPWGTVVLSYGLVGIGGEVYYRLKEGLNSFGSFAVVGFPSQPPTFAIYKNNTKIASGTFGFQNEYG